MEWNGKIDARYEGISVLGSMARENGMER